MPPVLIPPSRRAFIAGVGAAVTVAACGGSARDLPPNEIGALQAIFDPLFEPLGQRLTRGGLFDLDAGYVADDQGGHLALYVEPVDPDGIGWTPERYLERFVPGAAASTPFVFETWGDLTSMDICQEPPQAESPEPEPPVETQLFIFREDAARLDWQAASLVDLLALEMRYPDTTRIGADVGVDQLPAWLRAEREARKQVHG